MPEPVALQRCADYRPALLEPALDALLASLGGLESMVSAGDTVILKPNLIAACPPDSGATTHPAVLESLARRLLDLGARPAIADAPAWGGPKEVAAATGVQAVCDRLGLEFIYLDRHTHLPSACPQVSKAFHVDPRIAGADHVINVPKLKAHQQLGFTGAMKNLYGCLAGREKAWHHMTRCHTDPHFARFLAAFQASLRVTLHVVDGVLSMDGPGPRLGRPRQVGVLAASRGSVEVDAVGAAILGAPPSHRLLLDAARELGLGETELADLSLVGDPLDELRVTGFLWPELIGVGFSPWRIVRGYFRNRRMLHAEQH